MSSQSGHAIASLQTSVQLAEANDTLRSPSNAATSFWLGAFLAFFFGISASSPRPRVRSPSES